MSFVMGLCAPKGRQLHFNNTIECVPIPGLGNKLSDCITLCSSHASLLCAVEREVGAPHVTCDVSAGPKVAAPFCERFL